MANLRILRSGNFKGILKVANLMIKVANLRSLKSGEFKES